MKKLRVLIVDDSPFSQTVIRRALESGEEFEVCGVAETGREGIEAYRRLSPDVVTMDVTMPDMDGLACSREILAYDAEAKIVMLSAMKDEALVNHARVIGIQVFLQKPVKAPELLQAARMVCGEEFSHENWQERYVEFFMEAIRSNIQDMLSLDCLSEPSCVPQGGKFVSRGLAIIISLTGHRGGRMILDCRQDVATRITEMMLEKKTVTDEEVLHSAAEIANIICGHAVTKINNAFMGSEIRLTPPSILFGKNVNIVNPKLQSYLITVDTCIGQLVLSIGLMGGN